MLDLISAIGVAILAALAGVAFILFAFALSLGMDLLLAIVLQLAWNYVMPTLFHLPVVTYWQAFALLVVASLLLKSTAAPISKKD